MNAGTVAFTQGLNTATFDATAIAAINTASTPYSLVTQRQFRPNTPGGVAAIYNIIAYDQVAGIATMDRPIADPGGTGLSYQIYQLYYTPPMLDFLTWLDIRNMQMFLSLNLLRNRAWIDEHDPQRSFYLFPTHAVPYGIDLRGAGTVNASATLGFPMFELWGQPTNNFVYTCYGIRRGVDLVNPTDTLPIQLADDLVLTKAREYAYEWAESNKDMSPRSSGPDFRFLMGKAHDDYNKLLTKYRKQDKELVDNYCHIHRLDIGAIGHWYYSTISSTAGTGG